MELGSSPMRQLKVELLMMVNSKMREDSNAKMEDLKEP